MSAVMSQDSNELSCVLIPAGAVQLLLPNVTVAEVLPWRRVKPVAEAPVWCLGLVGWRGESVPVIRHELLNGGGDETLRRTGRCLTIMNRAGSDDGVPFYAIATDRLPRLIHVSAAELELTSEAPNTADLLTVKVGADEAVVPNIALIENELAKLKNLWIDSG
ncbi:MAG: chemotaxis protein CheW [Gammaproteobacteria bacterium]|nr:chemotaxis protein CheW [Gammaproteobacteria bacterium]